jgi:dolichol kinase
MPPVDRSRGYNRVLRKSLHITGGAFAFTLPYMPAWLFLAGAACITAAGYLLKPRMGRLIRQLSKPSDRRSGSMTGVRAYFATLVILAFIWIGLARASVETPWVYAQFGWLSMALGDGLAGLVGPRPGRTRTVPWNKHKTWWGVLGCLIGVALAWALVVPALFIGAGVGLAPQLFAAALTVVSVALIESLRLKVDDNLMVGLGSAVALAISALTCGVL